ncbi:hypothetical protein RND71_010785 [Anisodus tanguticus]|uniref:Uncharacterized protein n=1 Tax=Anisodus tanguticus TaxID=243964 RepID=A0AAE1SJX7_9SOLA|nr:hypothetical protein RND71_010785 [Anisodus tanguticus]
MLAHCTKSSLPPADVYLPTPPYPRRRSAVQLHFNNFSTTRTSKLQVKANNTSDGVKNAASSPSSTSSVPNTNYVVPLDKSSSSCITRPLDEILRDLNKRIPDNIIKADDNSTFIPWYHANRMLSFYAPEHLPPDPACYLASNIAALNLAKSTPDIAYTWFMSCCQPAHRESTGTVSPGNGHSTDLVAAAEEIAFCRACGRFGLGLYLYH